MRMSWIADNWETMITAVLGMVATVGAWSQGKKTAKGSHLDNVDKAIEIWEKLAAKFEDKVAVLESQHSECEKTKDGLVCKVRDLEGSIDAVKRETEDCDRRYQALSREVDQWKAYVGKHIGFPDKHDRGKE